MVLAKLDPDIGDDTLVALIKEFRDGADAFTGWPGGWELQGFSGPSGWDPSGISTYLMAEYSLRFAYEFS